MDDDPSRARGRRRRSNDSPPQNRGKIPKREEASGSGDYDRSQPSVSGVKSGRSESKPARSDSKVSRDGARNRYEIVQLRKSGESKRGKSGEPVKLQTNYFALLKKPKWRIYQYHVTFAPEIEMRRVRGGVLSQHRELFGGYLFDGTKLFTTTKLDNDTVELQTNSHSGEVYKITIKFVGIISMTEWQSLQVLNLILRRAMEGLNLQLVGRNFFDAIAKIDMPAYRLQIWPGYVTSIRQCETDVLLCTEIAHKVMRSETVYDIMRRCIQENRDFHDAFKRQVFGLTVLTDYNNKTYKIDDVDFNRNPTNTFDMKGTATTFIDYYYQKYNIRIRDPKQPLLVSKSKDRQIRSGEGDWIILIPELCRATGLSENMRSNFQLTSDMSKITRLSPLTRIERLRTFNRRLKETAASMNVLRDWDMSLSADLVEVQGRVIKPQQIFLLNGAHITANEKADWGNCFKGQGLFDSPSRGLERWAIVVPSRHMRSCREFTRKLFEVGRGMRLNIRNAREHVIDDDRNFSYVRAIEDAAREDPQLILCIVPNNNDERYGMIKKKTCVERAIPTQVVTTKTATNQRGGMSIATKIAVQINCKLGYAPWMIDLPLSGLMTIGYDKSRSSRDKSKAYGALVASMDMRTNSTFFSTVAECHSSDLLSNEITISVCKALRQYQTEHSGSLPKKILIYRDGVGEGSLQQLVEHEVNVLVKKLEGIYEQQKKTLELAYIVVSKCNTRFFARKERESHPRPGTVVDDIVTLPEHSDFYLVSQSVRQGTVAPTYYNVVYSNMHLEPDRMQILTYKMCHLYYNWAGTTRVPAVCQYAKKLATLVSQNLHTIPANELEKKLYYL